MLDLLFEYENKNKENQFAYYILPSKNKPRVLIPIKKNIIKSGLDLYNPYSKLAKIFKFTFEYFPNIAPKLYVKEHSELFLYLEKVSKELFYVNEVVFAIYLGSPGKKAKITIQIMNDKGEKLGYIKLGENIDTKNMLMKEVTALKYLKANFPDLLYPNLLFEGEFKTNYISIQSGTPIESYQVSDKLGKHQIFFLKELSKKQYPERIEKLLFKPFSKYSEFESKLNSNIRDILLKSFDYLHQRKLKLNVSIAHGDFAAWNTFVINNELFVFDWEYFEEDCPVFYDILHYLVQYETLINKCNNGYELIKIINFNKYVQEFSQLINLVLINEYLLFYLLKSTINLIEEHDYYQYNESKSYINVRLEALSILIK